MEDSFTDGAERWARLWAKIRSMVCLSVLPLVDVVPGGPEHSSCFELFGFDIMVDSKLSRWGRMGGRGGVCENFHGDIVAQNDVFFLPSYSNHPVFFTSFFYLQKFIQLGQQNLHARLT